MAEQVGRRTPHPDRSIDLRSAIVVPDLRAVVADNEGRHQGAVIGALGTALAEHGWQTAVVADHDRGAHVDRVAALALARPYGDGPAGVLDRGSVGSTLTTDTSPRASDPHGLGVTVGALAAPRQATIVEIGDVAWAEAAGAGRAARRAAVAGADVALAAVTQGLGPNDLLIVLASTAPSGREQPTPFLLVGPGVRPGLAESATTRRAGYVTLPDVAPTILDALGIPVPAAMNGTPITADAAGGGARERIATLRSAIAEARFVDRATGVFLVTLPIVFSSWALLALLAAVLPLGRFRPAARGFVRWMGLVVAVVPITTYLLGAVSVRTWGQPAWSGAAWTLAALIGGAAWWLRPPVRSVLAVSALLWTVLVVDVATGGALQFGTVLGNSPTVAGRFAGMGNNAFSLLAASTLVLAVAAWQAVERRRPGGPALLAAGAVFAVAIAIDGAPGLGSDVGGVLALGPVAALTMWSLSGRRTSWRRAAAGLAGTVGVLGLLTLVDLSRPARSQTHLGRLARRLTDGGGGGDVVIRKGLAALASFRASSLVWIPISAALLAGLLWAFARPQVRALLERPLARTLVAGGLALALLGTALNDSGVMVAAMMATVLVPAALHVLLSEPDGVGAAPGSAP
ncbi:hypothetical protein KSP35_04205 [Aquihabitans sp. G128]|uniref:hypothetical protein n=1 Tax=Aquihabitans sp. G128 TaxID=2849779 RepID=UPI001C223191|nr:hypothetical protein [Aquihabitans sp. G128]QXC62025.1 hypothetical protein KSP35_04205 [Aquihabitans sp. G128]